MSTDWIRRSLGVVVCSMMMAGTWGQLQAGLEFESKELTFKPSLGEKQVVGEFKFKNTGKTTITIKDLNISCDCTTAKLDKKVYEPGESGVIPVTFTIGQRQNLQEKSITVITDEPKTSTTRLLMKVYIPVILSIEPRYVFWLQGDKDPKSQTVTIKNLTDKPVKVLAASSALPPSLVEAATTRPALMPKIEYKLETVKEGWEYTLTIKPTDLTSPSGLPIELKTDLPEEGPRYQIIAMVRPAEWAEMGPATRPGVKSGNSSK